RRKAEDDESKAKILKRKIVDNREDLDNIQDQIRRFKAHKIEHESKEGKCKHVRPMKVKIQASALPIFRLEAASLYLFKQYVKTTETSIGSINIQSKTTSRTVPGIMVKMHSLAILKIRLRRTNTVKSSAEFANMWVDSLQNIQALLDKNKTYLIGKCNKIFQDVKYVDRKTPNLPEKSKRRRIAEDHQGCDYKRQRDDRHQDRPHYHQDKINRAEYLPQHTIGDRP
ncbi:hypothetical protein CU098_013062, partial [Rhizopus stolonifer]